MHLVWVAELLTDDVIRWFYFTNKLVLTKQKKEPH